MPDNLDELSDNAASDPDEEIKSQSQAPSEDDLELSRSYTAQLTECFTAPNNVDDDDDDAEDVGRQGEEQPEEEADFENDMPVNI